MPRDKWVAAEVASAGRRARDSSGGTVRLPPEPVRLTSEDPDEAADILSGIFLANKIQSVAADRPFRMELRGLQLGGITVGRLGYGTQVQQRSAEAESFHVDTPLRGSASYRYGGEPEVSSTGSGLAFSPGSPGEVRWSEDCVQLCLMIPPARLELALSQALGRAVRAPVTFDRQVEVAPHVARQWRSLVAFLADELVAPTGVTSNVAAGSHLESFVLDSLVLDYPHNYRADALAPAPRAASTAVQKAVELIEERPTEPWSVLQLASEVHLSPRALQDGFSRDLGVPPMAYLRQVRLRRVHEALLMGDPEHTSVRTLAFNNGFLHMGRFAAVYRQAFGVLPSETLRRERPSAASGDDPERY